MSTSTHLGGNDPSANLWYAHPTCAEVGEKKLLTMISHIISKCSQPVVVGIGDDAAVIDFSAFSGSSAFSACNTVVVSTDTAVENQHFRKEWITPYDLGRRVIVQSCADILAMKAQFRYALLAITVPGNVSAQVIAEIIAGAQYQSNLWGAEIIGGDLTQGEIIV